MEGKWAKAEHSGKKVVVKLGPEDIAAKGRSCAVQVSPLQKRKRLDEGTTKYGCPDTKSILRRYGDFMKSGLPQRVLFLQEGEWTDFPPPMLELIRENFQRKNAVIDLMFDNYHLLLDILHMVQLDFNTFEEKSIAWIDDAGKCFFPGPYSCPSSCNSPPKASASLDNNEINLQLDIQINGLNGCDAEEHVAESNPHRKRLKAKDSGPYDKEHVGAIGHAKDTLAVNPSCNWLGRFGEECAEPHLRSLDAVREFFLSRMSAIFVGLTNVLTIGRCSDYLMRTRLGLFEKQIEITRNCRGNPNVTYAWLAVNRDASSKIMMYGLGAGGFKTLSISGSGVHLTSVNNPHLSARFCDDDENGVKYIVLCRVVLGSVEVVDIGSKRFQPSDERFDSGVDNIENPKHYFVWEMNMNSHIFPEYVISYRMHPEGNVIGRQARISASDATVTQKFLNEEQKNLGKDLMDTSSTVKSQKSPWMPFPSLLNAISTEVRPNDMKAIDADYNCFRSKKITRMEFIKRLRKVVGDELLRTTIKSYRSQIPPRGATAT
ncbi:hypothetical protein MLD38_020812 [Melastoma candidum]|uniref:Uncharacterized protein n=1 Tax=Melastoma candidum TaxID=119954 RepID=A0ACB9QHX0_9MYRT|nr:hypothetical protein MLD38_020812 [Melastoma candidum]